MAFISLSPELKAKSFTGIENKFITKYMPVLDPLAVKVYMVCTSAGFLARLRWTTLRRALALPKNRR